MTNIAALISILTTTNLEPVVTFEPVTNLQMVIREIHVLHYQGVSNVVFATNWVHPNPYPVAPQQAGMMTMPIRETASVLPASQPMFHGLTRYIYATNTVIKKVLRMVPQPPEPPIPSGNMPARVVVMEQPPPPPALPLRLPAGELLLQSQGARLYSIRMIPTSQQKASASFAPSLVLPPTHPLCFNNEYRRSPPGTPDLFITSWTNFAGGKSYSFDVKTNLAADWQSWLRFEFCTNGCTGIQIWAEVRPGSLGIDGLPFQRSFMRMQEIP